MNGLDAVKRVRHSHVNALGWSEVLAHVWACALGDDLAALRSTPQQDLLVDPELVEQEAPLEAVLVVAEPSGDEVRFREREEGNDRRLVDET
jgi:hypothetical protein